MPLPAAALLAALGTAARVGGRIALRKTTKLIRGTPKVVKRGNKRIVSGGRVIQRDIVKPVKRHLKFYKSQLLPGGTEPNKAFSKKGFKRLIKRPTMGQTTWQPPITKFKHHSLGLYNKKSKWTTGFNNTNRIVKQRTKKARNRLMYGGGFVALKTIYGDD
mgnify:CR=1 FL=1